LKLPLRGPLGPPDHVAACCASASAVRFACGSHSAGAGEASAATRAMMAVRFFSIVAKRTYISNYFFVAEGSLPYCPSTPFARQVQASRPPLLRMLSLRIDPLLAPLSVWRWPLSVDTCPPVMTYKANTGQTRRFLQRSEPGAASHCVDHAPLPPVRPGKSPPPIFQPRRVKRGAFSAMRYRPVSSR
jgi:hypothetical protein